MPAKPPGDPSPAPSPHPRDVPLPQWVVQAHRRDLRGLAFTPDGARLISIGDDPPVHIWDAWTGARLRSLPGHARGGEALAVHPDGTQVATAGRDKLARIWDLADGGEIRALAGHTGAVTAIAYSPDGAFIGTGSTDRTVRLWDAHTGEAISTWTGHADPVRFVTFTRHDGFPWLWSGCESGLFLGGPVGAAKAERRDPGHRVIARDPHQERLIVRDTYRDAIRAPQAAVRLFGPDGVGPIESRLLGHLGEVRCATFTPDGIALTGSADRGLRRFAVDGALTSHLRAGGAACDVLAVHPAGSLVAIGDADGRLLVYARPAVFDAEYTPHHGHAISAIGLDDLGRPWSLGRDGRLVVRDDALEPAVIHALRPVDSMHTSAGFIGGGWWKHGPITLSSTRVHGLERWELVNRPSVERHVIFEQASGETLAHGPSRVAVAMLDRTLVIYAAESLSVVATVPLESYPVAVAVGPDEWIAVADDGGLVTTCDRDGGRIMKLDAPRASALTYGDDGALYIGRADGRLRVLRAGADPIDVPAHTGAIRHIAAAGDRVLTAGDDRRLIAWDATPKPITEWVTPVPITALALVDGAALYGDAAGAMGRFTLPR